MKKTMFLIACLVAMATTVSAQFTNSGSTKSGNLFGGDSYTGIRLHYNSFEIDNDVENPIPSFGVTIIKGWSISSNKPLFLEAGFGISYTNGETSDPIYQKVSNIEIGVENTTRLISTEIPVNIGYKFNINENFSIMPFAGATVRFNIIGKTETKSWNKKPSISEVLASSNIASGTGRHNDSNSKLYNSMSQSLTSSYAKDGYDTNGYKEETIENDFKRMQLGWQIGVRAMYKKYNIGISYGSDINKIASGCRAISLIFSAGYNF